MTLVDIESMPSAAMIMHYVVECRGKGLFLPYADHEVIQEWLTLTDNPDQLLIALSEVLPTYFEKDRIAGRPPGSLVGVRKKVNQRLKDQSMRSAGTR
jgi:hypothetical protein